MNNNANIVLYNGLGDQFLDLIRHSEKKALECFAFQMSEDYLKKKSFLLR